MSTLKCKYGILSVKGGFVGIKYGMIVTPIYKTGSTLAMNHPDFSNALVF